MAVMGTWPLRAPGRVEAGQAGVEPPAHHQQLEAGRLGQLEDQGMGIDGEQTGVEVLHRLDQDHRVLATADGDEQATGPPNRLGPRAGRGRVAGPPIG